MEHTQRHEPGDDRAAGPPPAPPSPLTLIENRPPAAHAAVGAGVVVTDGRGRVLLGLARDGVWELPGGKLDPGESFEQAAVRELREETGLAAAAADARVLAVLVDAAAQGLARLTAAVRVTRAEGEPAVTEPDRIDRWQWHEVAALPGLGSLFRPSAHVLDVVWPGVLPGLPPVHRHAVRGA
ncbi:DNA mismatch repair protein MutT [Streptomyces longispororuber]|uniref:DNA mismatch repair protein MutT n=1 Tax=Streptomyces longispororuber TaxID=68230 RepID=A0A919DIK9_9ACTN|nr:NUDIX hydrolase [Streptomyces longispororuber]GHE46049.1 DNA mismatch repair protein MutT [Streptomyces longispororuber]